MTRDKERGHEADFLGGRVSAKHPMFLELAQLGYNEAEQYSMVTFMEWFVSDEGAIATPFQILKKLITLVGQATFLKRADILTRLSMILGYKERALDYDSEK